MQIGLLRGNKPVSGQSLSRANDRALAKKPSVGLEGLSSAKSSEIVRYSPPEFSARDSASSGVHVVPNDDEQVSAVCFAQARDRSICLERRGNASV